MSRYIDIDDISLRKTVAVGGMSAKALWRRIQEAPSIDIVRRKPVKGYEGYYEVDMYGNVYSVGRTVRVNDNGREYDKPVKEKKLTASKHSQGYRTVFCNYGEREGE